MATQLWNQEIDKTVDWGGDNSTGGAAVSGQYVQKFIKDTLAKKFGYLHYDKANLKYQVFADKEDYDLYSSNPSEYSNLVLATFDAPAPASINAEAGYYDEGEWVSASQDVTILSSVRNNYLRFRYVISDSNSKPISEAITCRITVNNAGTIRTLVRNYEPDYKTFNTGTFKEELIDEYLTVGTNNITILLTGVTTQATTTLTFKYTVVELKINSDFNNKDAFYFDSTANDLIGDNTITVPFNISGQGEKYMRWYVNGEPLDQDWVNRLGNYNAHSNEYGPLRDTSLTSNMLIYLVNQNGELSKQFKVGKNTLQFYIYIKDNDGVEIPSNTLYYDIVILDKNDKADVTYILYSQELGSGAVFKPTDTITFDSTQYQSTAFDYSLFSTTGKTVGLTFELTKRPGKEGESAETFPPLYRSIISGEIQTFLYTFLTYGVIDIRITTDLKDLSGNPVDTLNVVVNVAEAPVQIKVLEEDRVLNLEAINRSNAEPNPAEWKYNNISATFDKVYWNTASGWDGEALVLNNGATVTIPYNIFQTYQTTGGAGTTFEIDFEVINVQDEEAPILKFENPNASGNTTESFIRFTASEARIGDRGGNEVYTKFNSNTRVKIAFIMNPYVNNYDGTNYRNCIFLMVNGILDKCDMTNGQLPWTNSTGAKIVIGNPDGVVGVKLHSVRVYNKALSLDEELVNYIAECSDILSVYEKNNVYEEDTTSVSLNILKNLIPTAVIYGDMDKFNAFDNKKDNLQFDLEFYDPTDPARDFFARSIFCCNQGTSSLNYPIRNLRPYFNKTVDTKTTKDETAEYFTEVYLAGEFVHGETNNQEKLGNFNMNAKTCADGYHKLYNIDQALKCQKNGQQLFYISGTSNGKNVYSPCSIDATTKKTDSNGQDVDTWYIQAYAPVKAYEVDGGDDYWKVIKDLRLSGWKLYTKGNPETVVNPEGNEYTVYKYTKVKSSAKLDPNTQYYTDKGYWKQYEKSGYTNVWTYKTDYAESSMCNNAGTGRLWNDCMANVSYGGKLIGQTGAQAAVEVLKTINDQRIDIRTACDGKPIVVFNCELEYAEDGKPKVDANGYRVYKNAKFIGLYNIMTDKSSTNLFGFEDIYSENGGEPIFAAPRVECWECLTNAGEFSQGLTTTADFNEPGKPINTDPEARSIWGEFESRWPDVGGFSHTHNLESLWRFINFCKPAVNYTIGGQDGYTLSPYIELPEDKYDEFFSNEEVVYIKVVMSGNETYEELDYKSVDDFFNNAPVYYKSNEVDYSNITRELSGIKITGDIYTGRVPGFDAKSGIFNADIQFDAERVENPLNGLDYETNNKIAGSPVEEDYYVNVYLERSGSRYLYTDSWGTTNQVFAGTPEMEVDKNGDSYNGKTYMDYFSEKKYEHFDVQRLALYYIYVIRFAAVDQVVKNTMLTTEDGIHYYYINYDNDTILGVRNDGNMVFHWNIDRNSYDRTKNAFCFAGNQSVLWNLLECDEDFMNVVKEMDNAMYTSKVLSKKIALDMYNVKQEGTWSERLYNVQEEVKYLSQWQNNKGTDPKYLAFIHGSANQYRSWFIENRFDLYDSKWKSGEFMTTKITFRLDTMKASMNSPLDMFDIKAARQSLFFLSNSDGTYKDIAIWNKELGVDETATWSTPYPIFGNSSPWSLYGSDKIKVLDFRKSVGKNELQIISFEDNTNWIEEKGCLMTGFLIGTSDEYIPTEVYRYENITDEVQTINNVEVQPGKYYDASREIGNYNIEHFKYLGLQSVTVSPIESIGGLGKLTTLEEIDIRNCFNPATKALQVDLTNLNNLHIYRAIGSSITEFEPAIGVTLNEVSLPLNRITKFALNEATLVKAEGQDAPILKYEPDYALETLVLKNVSCNDSKEFDIVKFISKWIEEFEANQAPNSTRTLKNLALTLEGVNLTKVEYSWLEKLNELNIISFTGKVEVLGSAANNALTQEEYENLMKMYGDNVFDPSSSLQFTSAAGFFWSVDLEKTQGSFPFDSSVTEYYEAQHGVPFTFRGTKFPVEADDNIYFRFTTNTTNNVWSQTLSTNNVNTSTMEDANKNYVLSATRNSNGSFTFKSDIHENTTRRNVDRYIKLIPCNAKDNSQLTNVIYVKLNKTVLPENIIFEVPENYSYENNEITIDSNDKFDVLVKYSNSNDVNVNIKSMEVSLEPFNGSTTKLSDEQVEISRTLGRDKVHTISIKPFVQPRTVSGTIYVKFEFDSEIENNIINTSIKYKIETKVSTEYTLDVSGYEYVSIDESGSKPRLNIHKASEQNNPYKFEIIPVNDSNVDIFKVDYGYDDSINIPYTRCEIKQENGKAYLMVTVTSSGENSYNDEFSAWLDIVPGYDYWKEQPYKAKYDFIMDSSIIYPDNLRMIANDINLGTDNLVINTSSNNENNLSVTIEPFNSSISDEITCEYKITKIEAFEVTYDDDKVIESDLTNEKRKDQTIAYNDLEISHPVLYAEIGSGDNKTLNIVVNKYKNEIGEFENSIDEAEVKFVLTCSYNVGGTSKEFTKEVSFKVIWSIAVCNTIDLAAPYNDDNGEECEWYLVDINNNYYKLLSETFNALRNANKLEEMIGLAKRINIASNAQEDMGATAWQYDKETKDGCIYVPCAIPLANYTCINNGEQKNAVTLQAKSMCTSVVLPTMYNAISNENYHIMGLLDNNAGNVLKVSPLFNVMYHRFADSSLSGGRIFEGNKANPQSRITGALEVRMMSRALLGNELSTMLRNFDGSNAGLRYDDLIISETEIEKACNTEADEPGTRSALALAWNHFKKYTDSPVSKENKLPEPVKTNIHCYPAGWNDLYHLFGDSKMAGMIRISVTTVDGVSVNTKLHNIYTQLQKTGLFDIFENTFIECFYNLVKTQNFTGAPLVPGGFLPNSSGIYTNVTDTAFIIPNSSQLTNSDSLSLGAHAQFGYVEPRAGITYNFNDNTGRFIPMLDIK